jgi:competence protein ComFC
VKKLAGETLVNNLFAGMIDLLYPPRCLLCGALGENSLCHGCLDTLITPVPLPYCLRCGQIKPGAECHKCVDFEASLIRCRAVGVYDGDLADIIHQLKYRDRPMLAQPLASIMADFLVVRAEIMNDLHFDAIVPVPLHKSRERSRGYNQSERIARHLSQSLNLLLDTKVLQRTRSTNSQVGKLRAERLSNLESAFRADPARCTGKTFLLIDDVLTTGSTLNECAKALLAAGANKVYAVTLALG